MFCDYSNKMNRRCIEKTGVCRCLHRIKVKLGSIVELLIYDVEDSLTHPFHLHGHKFYVMDMDTFNKTTTVADILKYDIPAKKKQFNTKPPHKDSIPIPNPGYVRLKFRADNPGFWLGHCHFVSFTKAKVTKARSDFFFLGLASRDWNGCNLPGWRAQRNEKASGRVCRVQKF
jgi:Multicopper oxidase